MGTLPSSSSFIDKTPTICADPVVERTSSDSGDRVPTRSATAATMSRFRWFHRGILLIGIILASLTLSLISPTEASARSSCGDEGCVDVVAVDGIIDDIVADFISESVRRANEAGDVVAVVLQMDSLGTAISNERLDDLAGVIADSRVPVSVWIGASGARALGGAAELALIADSSGIAPGARIGDLGQARLDPALLPGRDKALEELSDRVLTGQKAVDAGVVDRFDPTLVDHIGNLESVDSKVVTVDGNKQRQPVQRVRLSKLPLPIQIMHTAASPSVAYLLLVIGVALLLFEFFTAGVGVAGVVGAGFLLLGGYGLAELPYRPWALGLLIFSFVAFAVDMQTGLARLWTWIGFVSFAISSLMLMSEFRPTWLALITGVGGMAAVVFRGMPAMNRARFGTPYIGREWLEGQSGTVTRALQPVGTVRIREVDWTARAAEGFDGTEGTEVTIVGSDRMTLEAAPVESAHSGGPNAV